MKKLTDDQISKLVDANAQKSVCEITRICLEAMYGISEISESRKHSIKRHTVCLGKKQTLELLKKSLIWNPPSDTAKPYIKVLTHFLAQLRNARYVGHAYNGPAKTEWRCRLQKAELTRDRRIREHMKHTKYILEPEDLWSKIEMDYPPKPEDLRPMSQEEFERVLKYEEMFIPPSQLQKFVAEAALHNVTPEKRFRYVSYRCRQYRSEVYKRENYF